MTKTFTQDDVIRYLYNETSNEEKKAIEQALVCDNQLLEVFQELSAVVKQFDEAQIQPSEKTIENIVNYSKSLNLHPSK
jgi:hypothetical protein